jgi:hypothetical protein
MEAAFLGNYPVFESPEDLPVKGEPACTKPGAGFQLAISDVRAIGGNTRIFGSNKSLNEAPMIKRLNHCLLIVLAG